MNNTAMINQEEITVSYVEVSGDINILTAEINTLTAQGRAIALSYVVEIGRRLQAAKRLLGHGAWGPWLEDAVHYSQSTAENYMRIAEEYGQTQFSLFTNAANSQTLENLGYSKLVALLALPAEERADFAEDVGAEALSTRQFQEEIRKYKEQLTEAQAEAERYKELYEDEMVAAEGDNGQWKEMEETIKRLEAEALETKNALAVAEADLQGLKGVQVDILTDPEVIAAKEAAAKEAAEAERQKLQKKLDKLQKDLDKAKEDQAKAEAAAAKKAKAAADEAAQAAKEQAKREIAEEMERYQKAADEAKETAEALEKKVKIVGDPALHKLNFCFSSIQQHLSEIKDCLASLHQSGHGETADKTAAVIKNTMTELLQNL